MHFSTITEARNALKIPFDAKRKLRKFFCSDLFKDRKKNFGIVMHYVLNVIHDSEEDFCSMSRDTISLYTGIPEKTVEYNINKMIKLGILIYHTIPSNRNSNNRSKILLFNTEFNPKIKKILPKKNCPKLVNSIKQIECSLLSGLGELDFFKLEPIFQAISLLLGSHGFKLDILPSIKKKLKLNNHGLNYLDLDETNKILYLINHFEANKNACIQIKIPENYVMVDIDDSTIFDKFLCTNYLGGFIIKSPRGGKFLYKKSTTEINFQIADFEFHYEGRNDCILGKDYKILSLDSIDELELSLFDEFDKKPLVPVKKLVDIKFISGKIPKGLRNDFLFRLGRKLKVSGILDFDTMYNTLRHFNNDKMVEKLPLNEVFYMAKHCIKYKNTPNFYVYN